MVFRRFLSFSPSTSGTRCVPFRAVLDRVLIILQFNRVGNPVSTPRIKGSCFSVHLRNCKTIFLSFKKPARRIRSRWVIPVSAAVGRRDLRAPDLRRLEANEPAKISSLELYCFPGELESSGVWNFSNSILSTTFPSNPPFFARVFTIPTPGAYHSR